MSFAELSRALRERDFEAAWSLATDVVREDPSSPQASIARAVLAARDGVLIGFAPWEAAGLAVYGAAAWARLAAGVKPSSDWEWVALHWVAARGFVPATLLHLDAWLKWADEHGCRPPAHICVAAAGGEPLI